MDSNHQPLVHHERSTMLLSELPSRHPSVPLAPHAPPGHGSYPHRLNGINYEQIPLICGMADAIVVFYSFNAIVVRGSLPGYADWTAPALRAAGFLDVPNLITGARDSSLLPSATPTEPSHRFTGHPCVAAECQQCQGTLLCPQGGLALSILPFGGTALVLLRRPLSQEAMK